MHARIGRDARGAVMIEYVALLAAIALGVFAAMSGVAGETLRLWTSVSSAATAAS